MVEVDDLSAAAAVKPISGAGIDLRHLPTYGQAYAGPLAGHTLGQAHDQTSNELIRRGITIALTLEVRPGHAFYVPVTQDLVFPGPYDDTVQR